MAAYSKSYIQLKTQGAFPNRVDPWAETGRFFHQLHSEIISHMLGQLQMPLLAMGYVAGRETSLQIAENRQPDVYIQRMKPTEDNPTWDYSQAAEAVLAEPGILFEGTEPELDAIQIKDADSGQLVTVVEVISPRNKNDHVLIREYQERRDRLLTRQINVVEIDLTRSIKRLIAEPIAETYPYHVAVHLYDQNSRFIGMELTEPLKRFAVPLRAEVTPIDLQAAYQHAYERTSIAWHIDRETHYVESALTFPSTLTNDQRRKLSEQVKKWHEKLQQLT